MRRHIALFGVLTALVWGLVAAPASATPITIGAGSEVDGDAAPLTSFAGGVYLQTGAGPGHSYTVPAGYRVISAWRHRTGNVSGIVAFKVYRPTSPGLYLTLASESHQVSAGVNEVFPTRILVEPGDVLGISSTTGVQLVYPGGPGDSISGTSTGLIDTEWPQVIGAMPGPPGLLDVAAVLERDVDGDGYGDDTQDGCPTDPWVHGVCLTTTFTKTPPKRVYTRGRKATVKVAFTSLNPEASFQCSVDYAAFSPCVSPYTKRYRLGPHVLSVRAVDPSGGFGLQRASLRFKVVHRRH